MRVAIILTGHMRCWEQVFPTFKQRFIDRYNPDIFIHTWKDQAWWDPHSKEGFVANSPDIDIEAIRQHYKPVEMVVQDFEYFRPYFEAQAENFEKHYHVKRNILSMFYKLGQGVHLMEEHMMKTGKQYDLVIRMRPDLVFNVELPNFDPNKFYTIHHRNHVGLGTGDTFQASNPWLMSIFAKLPLILPQIYKRTDILCPHIVSKQFLEDMGYPWEEFVTNTTLMHTPAGPYVPKEAYFKR